MSKVPWCQVHMGRIPGRNLQGFVLCHVLGSSIRSDTLGFAGFGLFLIINCQQFKFYFVYKVCNCVVYTNASWVEVV